MVLIVNGYKLTICTCSDDNDPTEEAIHAIIADYRDSINSTAIHSSVSDNQPLDHSTIALPGNKLKRSWTKEEVRLRACAYT